MRHPTESALLSFAQGQPGVARAADVRAHLECCLACSLWAARLRRARVTTADDSAAGRLTAVGQAVPEALHLAFAAPAAAAVPAAGDVWRAGGPDEALLVWVRGLSGDSAVVIPVTLDVELADEYTLIIPASESPLGLDLALFATVEAHADMRAFLQRIGALPVGDQVTRLLAARADGRTAPPGLLTGAPSGGPSDLRPQYRRLLSDLLSSLAATDVPGAALPGDSDDKVAVDGLADILSALTWRRPGVEISPLEAARVEAGHAHELVVNALVRDLDAAVLIAVLTGADPAGVLGAPDIARACGGLLMIFQDADDVAVAIPDEDWTAVVVTPEFANHAVEAPSGRVCGPRIGVQPLPLADALLRHLDSRVTRWEEAERLQFDRDAVDVAALAAAVSQAAVERAIAEGRRARTPAKKAAYTGLDDGAVARIRSLIESAAAAGASPVEDVNVLLAGPR
jgi:hypothetical protein